MAGSCEHGNESSVSIQGGGHLDKLSDYQILKRDSVPYSYLTSYIITSYCRPTMCPVFDSRDIGMF
jgi:hypothetical protein